MVEQDGMRVAASLHAATRALERVPFLAGRSRPFASRWLELTAFEALIAGRKARRAPRWCIRESDDKYERRGRARAEGTQRFVWDDAESVALLMQRVADDRGGSAVWLIKTVVVAGE